MLWPLSGLALREKTLEAHLLTTTLAITSTSPLIETRSIAVEAAIT